MPGKPRVLDLFCGIGGLSMGLERAGCLPLGGVDIWEEAAATFNHNHPQSRCHVADLSQISSSELVSKLGVKPSDIDVIVGGPPCQGFSTIGKRNSSDPRNRLWEHYFELVAQIRPAYVLIENVEGLVVMEKGKLCQHIVETFGQHGYHMKWKIVRASDYGVPQLRKRVIFLGWLDGLAPLNHPKPTVDDYVTVADAIFDLPELGAGESTTEYLRPAESQYQQVRRGKSHKLHNHEAAKHPPHLVEILKHIPDGGNRKSIPDKLQPKSGFHNSYARLASDKPAIAVTSNMRKPSSARSTHPRQHRGLTVREGLRLQSFDDDFEVLGSRTSQYLQVGNAVPPLLAEAFGQSLVAAFRANSKAEIRLARDKTPAPIEIESLGEQLLLDI